MDQKLEDETFKIKDQTIIEKYWKGGIVFLVVIVSFAYLGFLWFGFWVGGWLCGVDWW